MEENQGADTVLNVQSTIYEADEPGLHSLITRAYCTGVKHGQGCRAGVKDGKRQR